jgi:hypothetical protein
MWPPWLPAPVTDDPQPQAIMGGYEPASPYLFKPYRPQRPWVWPTTFERAAPARRARNTAFDPQRVSEKLKEGGEYPAEQPGMGQK